MITPLILLDICLALWTLLYVHIKQLLIRQDFLELEMRYQPGSLMNSYILHKFNCHELLPYIHRKTQPNSIRNGNIFGQPICRIAARNL
jgi:hypothetical protein